MKLRLLLTSLGKGWAGSRPSGADDGNDFLVEITLGPSRQFRVPVLALDEVNVFLGQRGEQVLVENPVLFVERRAHLLVNLVENLFRVLAIRVRLLHVVLQALFQPGNANLEEFIEVGTENQQEHQPLEQGMLPVTRLGQHAQIELEVAQFAVFQIAAMAQVDVLALAEIIGVQIVVHLAGNESKRWHGVRRSHGPAQNS